MPENKWEREYCLLFVCYLGEWPQIAFAKMAFVHIRCGRFVKRMMMDETDERPLFQLKTLNNSIMHLFYFFSDLITHKCDDASTTTNEKATVDHRTMFIRNDKQKSGIPLIIGREDARIRESISMQMPVSDIDRHCINMCVCVQEGGKMTIEESERGICSSTTGDIMTIIGAVLLGYSMRKREERMFGRVEKCANVFSMIC